MPHNLLHMLGLRDIWRLWVGTLAGEEESFEYKGDVFDTPPVWIRIVMTVACLFGYALLLWQYITHGDSVAIATLSGACALTVYLIFIVPRAGQTAIVTVLFWGLLGGFALFWPV